MKKINDWVIKTFGLRGSWSWAKKQMLNGAIIKRKATTGTYKIAIDNDKNRLLVATWGHLDQNPVWERCPHSSPICNWMIREKRNRFKAMHDAKKEAI